LETTPDPDRLTPTPDPVERQQIERVRAVRAGRSASAWQAAIDAVIQAARNGDNLVPVIIGAVEARATLGEISDALRSVFGEFHEIATA
jgi:methylmalonyl-CoA mutase N-terminal domain/subunit